MSNAKSKTKSALVVDEDEEAALTSDESAVTHAPSPREELAAADVDGADDQSGNENRAISVEGTAPGELIEPPANSIIPLPEKPKLADGAVSTRALNQLPDGATRPEPAAPTSISTVREAVRAQQKAARGDSE